jgi:hypothetical protein
MTPGSLVYFNFFFTPNGINSMDSGSAIKQFLQSLWQDTAWASSESVRYLRMNNGELTVYGRTTMKSIVLTYPGYQTLPRGLKRMLVASENSFFSEATADRSNGKLQNTSLWRGSGTRMTYGAGGCLGTLTRAR